MAPSNSELSSNESIVLMEFCPGAVKTTLKKEMKNKIFLAFISESVVIAQCRNEVPRQSVGIIVALLDLMSC